MTKYQRGLQEPFLNSERLELAELAYKYKKEYDAEVKRNEGKTKYNSKLKKRVAIKPQAGYLSTAVHEFYTDLSKLRSDDPVFNKAIKMASRALNDIDSLRDPTLHPVKKFRGSRGGRKAKSPEV